MARSQALARHNANPTFDRLAPEIRGDFARACASLYYLRPKSKFDSETGEEIETEGDSGLVAAVLWPEQRRTDAVMQEMERRGEPVRVVKVKPRQSGDSSFGQLRMFHKVYWGRQQRGITVAHVDQTTASLYAMSKTLYNELPTELQVRPEARNSQELAFASPYSNSIRAQTAGNLNIGHGLTIDHAHLSEIDLWSNPNAVLEGLFEAVPLAPGTSIYIESKAQGAGGWLHEFWKNSKKGLTGFVPLFTPAFRVPTYRLPVPPDFEPTDEEIEWIAEHRVTPAFLMWYRRKRMEMIAKEPWGGERRFFSSYPLTDEQAFQSSGYCIFPDIVLQRLHGGLTGPKQVRRLELMPEPGQVREVPDDIDPRRAQLWVWKPPEEGVYYAVGVDVSDGVGEAASVVSVCKYPGYEQVAEWASTRHTVEEVAYIVRYLAEKYGGSNSLVIPEINRNGALILHILFQLPGSYSIFRWRYLNRPGLAVNDNAQLGWDCVSPDAKVLTEDLRWVRADEIQVGDALLGCEEKVRGRKGMQPRLGVQRVIGRKEFSAPMVEVRLTNGVTTKVSTNHPFWAHRKSLAQARWITAEDLKPGDRVKHLPVWEPLRSYDAGRLSAFLDGEGHLAQGPKYGVHLLVTQSVGPLADEIDALWKTLGFASTFKWVRHRHPDREHHKTIQVTGVTRVAQVLRALGSLRPTRLLRHFVSGFVHERMTLRAFEWVPVDEVIPIGAGAVIGLETSPDHTLIADGIVGHNTNDQTKRALAQVGNMVFLRGQGVVRSELLYEEMKICVDLGPRWAARGGRSDRVIAWMIAMMGAYLEFEGGNVANIASDRPRDLHAQVDDRDPATHDVDWQKILEPEPTVMSIYEREDLSER